ncbi:MAG: fasciclin domain-containing protein [Leptolyngbyaceae cyanobacterium CRU_2_3]|nr:fasciclin domain-containing protein [Leptolyngbyaceae cyanobacterium CRU_2_3]
MATFFHSSLIQSFSLAGLIGMELIFTAPGFTNPDQPQGLSDRFSSQFPVLELMPQILPQAGISVAQAQQDIIDTATAAGSFRTLLQLLDELGMTEDLRGYGRFTVFAPTDAAFAAVPPDIMEQLSTDRTLMSKVLAYHVIASASPLVSDQINTPTSVRTLERSEVRISRRGGRLYVNSARVTDEDIEASNGVIHVIDQVLIPDDLMSEIRR